MDLVDEVERLHESNSIADLKIWEEMYTDWSEASARKGNWYSAVYWFEHAKIVRLMREEREEGA